MPVCSVNFEIKHLINEHVDKGWVIECALQEKKMLKIPREAVMSFYQGTRKGNVPV